VLVVNIFMSFLINSLPLLNSIPKQGLSEEAQQKRQGCAINYKAAPYEEMVSRKGLP
jgi:hypothetical protein